MKRRPAAHQPAQAFETVTKVGLALPGVDATTKYDGSPVLKMGGWTPETDVVRRFEPAYYPQRETLECQQMNASRVYSSLLDSLSYFRIFVVAFGAHNPAERATKDPGGNKAVNCGRGGARPARREERAYRAYVSDEQRSPAGCIGGHSWQPYFRQGPKLRFALAAVVGLAVSAVPVSAHHSFAAEYDATRPLTVTGTVIKVEWTNPHARVYIDAKDENGKIVHWDFELGPPNGLMRRGWSRSSLKPGHVVTINGFHSKTEANIANARTVSLADGRQVFAGSSFDTGPAGEPTQ